MGFICIGIRDGGGRGSSYGDLEFLEILEGEFGLLGRVFEIVGGMGFNFLFVFFKVT